MPAHSSHFTQPFNIDYYNILKKHYGAEIDHFIKFHITYITKSKFFIIFKAAFFKIFTKKNILENFRGSKLIPYDPQAILSNLNIYLYTPISPKTFTKPSTL